MNISKKVFERMFKGKTKIPYKISIKGQHMTINLRLRWKYRFFKGFMDSMSRKTGKSIDMPKRFEAEENSFGFIAKNLEPTLKKIEKIESGKLRDFRMLTANVVSAAFEREKQDIKMVVTIQGVCRYDI